MSKCCIHLKSGDTFTTEDLTAIKVHSANNEKIFNAPDFTSIAIRSAKSYVFICQDKTYSVSGEDINYLEFSI